MEMTFKRAAELAVECQDASNLSGVLSSFKAAVHEAVWSEARRLGHGTRWVNQHPVCYLFIFKLLALNGFEPVDQWETFEAKLAEVKAIIAEIEAAQAVAA